VYYKGVLKVPREMIRVLARRIELPRGDGNWYFEKERKLGGEVLEKEEGMKDL
jgi:hypothetical protein